MRSPGRRSSFAGISTQPLNHHDTRRVHVDAGVAMLGDVGSGFLGTRSWVNAGERASRLASLRLHLKRTHVAHGAAWS